MLAGINSEVSYRTSRSSGAGGQHVNKVETRVELMFHVSASSVLTESEKAKIFIKLKTRISKDGTLIISCEESRSQARNKEIAFEKFINLLEGALKPEKKRVPTRPTKSSGERRLKNKKVQSDKKDARKFKDE